MSRMVAFTRLDTFGETTLEAIKVRIEAIEDAWQQVKSGEREIVKSADLLKLAETERKFAEAEEQFFTASATMRERLRQLESEERRKDTPPISVQVNMPFSEHDVKNTWGQFDGAITKWQGFRDRFVAAIHDNDRITPAYKFAYLKSSLVGKAARTLGEWQLSEKNYHEAWKRLNEMYHKQYATCRELLRQLFRLPMLQGPPRASELQRMSNVVHETLRQLAVQGVPTEHWDVIIVHMLHERLDRETACKWEETRSSEFPTVLEMCSFLERRATALESVQDRYRDGPSTSQQARQAQERRMETPPTAQLSRHMDYRARERPSIIQQARPAQRKTEQGERPNRPNERETMRKMPCNVCRSIDHPVWNCPEFQVLNLTARNRVVKEMGLCPNCLKLGHTTSTCYQGPCTRCPGRQMHNSVLCPMKELMKAEATVLRVQDDRKRKESTRETKEKRE